MEAAAGYSPFSDTPVSFFFDFSGEILIVLYTYVTFEYKEEREEKYEKTTCYNQNFNIV